ncbi:MAG: hypothetical protein Q4F11_06060 [Eubacteriales bacterium]|nr:hypothetical protein [Eubacteriales bacterium]
MSLITTKSTTITGQSVIKDEDGKDVQVVYMNVSVNENGTSSNINKSIQDKDMYIANREICRQDMAAFEDMMDALVCGEVTNVN